MGVFSKQKEDSAAASAEKALAAGRQVFIWQYVSTNQADAASMVESVEALGWRLDRMTHFLGAANWPTGVFLFRRVG